MTRRLIPFLIAIVAILAACGGSSSAPALTDPKDILTKTASSLQGVKTVHVKASLAGKVDPSVATGGAGGGASLDLTGSTLEGDINLAGSEAKLSAAVPSLLGLSADLVVADGTAYLKTSLTGDKYQKLDAAGLTSGLPLPSGLALPSAGASPDPSAAAAMVDQLKAQLEKLSPTKLEDAKCGDQDCYVVQVKLDSSALAGSSIAPLPSDMAGNATLTVYSRKSDNRPARLVIDLDAGAQGKLTLTVDLTNYDAAVTIAAPPADQVSDQPFALPGLTP